jgi:hypothetical protein
MGGPISWSDRCASRASARAPRCCAAVLFAVLLGCSITAPGGRSGDQLELTRNRERWAGAGIRDYEFEFQRSCFCLPAVTEPVRITVRNDVVTAVIRTRDGQPASATVGAWPTVDSLFADVQRRIEQNAERLDVEYDAAYGYPRSIAVDVLQMAADDEYFLTAANLRRLP